MYDINIKDLRYVVTEAETPNEDEWDIVDTREEEVVALFYNLDNALSYCAFMNKL